MWTQVMRSGSNSHSAAPTRHSVPARAFADPMTYALIALLLTGVAVAAWYVLARRATKVDLVVALHMNKGSADERR